MPELREYGATSGQKSTFPFPLVDSGLNYVSGLTLVSGDVKIMQDNGAWANATNSVTDEGEGYYSLVLTAAEMQAAIIVVKVVDQSSPKTWVDTSIIIHTGGDASSALWTG